MSQSTTPEYDNLKESIDKMSDALYDESGSIDFPDTACYHLEPVLRAARKHLETLRPVVAASPIVAVVGGDGGPKKCSPLSCDGCPQCRPVMAQGLPVDENVPLRTTPSNCGNCNGQGGWGEGLGREDCHQCAGTGELTAQEGGASV